MDVALVRWDDLLGTVAEALTNWGQPAPEGSGAEREFRDFSMDFQVDTVEGLPEEWPDAAVAFAAEEHLRRLANLLQADPHSRLAVASFPPAPDGTPPVLLNMGFSVREGVLDMSLVFRTNRFPDEFASWVGPAIHFQERLAGLLEVQRGRLGYFSMYIYTPASE